jgi:hypothetical protein
MRRAFEEQLNLISVPERFGGLSDASQLFATDALVEIHTNLAAADDSLGQNWSVSHLVPREIFHARVHGQLPDAAARQIADPSYTRVLGSYDPIPSPGSPCR